MADGTIFDQTQETELTASHRFLVQDTSAATASQSATFALAGGLEVSNETVTTADVTGVVGTLHVCTIAGLTANRNLTLPSAQIGERVGVYVVDGDPDYELILKGAASQTINGGTAATEWSRVFIQGECVIFRCIAANTWIVEYDGRIPAKAFVYVSTALTTTTANTTTVIDFSANCTTETDVGDIVDTTNDVIKIRRGGNYNLEAAAGSNANLSDGAYYDAYVRINGGATVAFDKVRSSGAYVVMAKGFAFRSLNAGDDVEYAYRTGFTDAGVIATDVRSHISVEEVF